MYQIIINASRDTIRKGTHELDSGVRIIDAYNARGRKKVDMLLKLQIMISEVILW